MKTNKDNKHIVRSVLAYTWAALCIVIVFMVFLNGSLPQILVKSTSMKIDPKYTGGEIVSEYTSDTLLTKIHEPVFPALFGESKQGFIQIEFHPVPADPSDTTSTEMKPLPKQIFTPIDYNGDGAKDFYLVIDTVNGDSGIRVCPSKQMAIGASSSVKDYWLVRVTLPNPRKSSSCAPSSCASCPAAAK